MTKTSARYVIFLYLLLCGGAAAIGQSSINPFELVDRLDSMNQFVPTQEQTEQGTGPSGNIFDIETRGSASSSSDSKEIGQDDAQQLEQSVELRELNQQQKENPFDVSHIPLRKSKLKSETDAFRLKSIGPEQTTSSDNSFLFWFLLLSGFILAIVINTNRRAIPQIVKSITNENILKFNHRESKGGLTGYYILLYGVFFVNFSIFLFLMAQRNVFGLSPVKYFHVLIGIVSFYLAKHLLLTIIGGIYPIYKSTSLYSFTIESFNSFVGICLIPMNLIIAFGPEKIAFFMIILTIVLLSAVLLIRILRGLVISSPYFQSHSLQFLLYLCGLEILPLLVISKVLI